MFSTNDNNLHDISATEHRSTDGAIVGEYNSNSMSRIVASVTTFRVPRLVMIIRISNLWFYLTRDVLFPDSFILISIVILFSRQIKAMIQAEFFEPSRIILDALKPQIMLHQKRFLFNNFLKLLF